MLLLHSVALLELLPDGVRSQVAAVAGHSLGEYTALVAAGSLGWQDAIALVRLTVPKAHRTQIARANDAWDATPHDARRPEACPVTQARD